MYRGWGMVRSSIIDTGVAGAMSKSFPSEGQGRRRVNDFEAPGSTSKSGASSSHSVPNSSFRRARRHFRFIPLTCLWDTNSISANKCFI